MLTHHALIMFKRHTGITKVRWVKLTKPWY